MRKLRKQKSFPHEAQLQAAQAQTAQLQAAQNAQNAQNGQNGQNGQQAIMDHLPWLAEKRTTPRP